MIFLFRLTTTLSDLFCIKCIYWFCFDFFGLVYWVSCWFSNCYNYTELEFIRYDMFNCYLRLYPQDPGCCEFTFCKFLQENLLNGQSLNAELLGCVWLSLPSKYTSVHKYIVCTRTMYALFLTDIVH